MKNVSLITVLRHSTGRMKYRAITDFMTESKGFSKIIPTDDCVAEPK